MGAKILAKPAYIILARSLRVCIRYCTQGERSRHFHIGLLVLR